MTAPRRPFSFLGLGAALALLLAGCAGFNASSAVGTPACPFPAPRP
jgi:hypothetical protein